MPSRHSDKAITDRDIEIYGFKKRSHKLTDVQRNAREWLLKASPRDLTDSQKHIRESLIKGISNKTKREEHHNQATQHAQSFQAQYTQPQPDQAYGNPSQEYKHRGWTVVNNPYENRTGKKEKSPEPQQPPL